MSAGGWMQPNITFVGYSCSCVQIQNHYCSFRLMSPWSKCSSTSNVLITMFFVCQPLACLDRHIDYFNCVHLSYVCKINCVCWMVSYILIDDHRFTEFVDSFTLKIIKPTGCRQLWITAQIQWYIIWLSNTTNQLRDTAKKNL